MRTSSYLISSWIKACIAAFQLLTKLYLPVRMDYTEDIYRRSIVFYPVVGAVLGIFIFVITVGLSMFLPNVVTAVCTLILWVWLTGGLHLDGLLDTADGIGSNRSKEGMLHIMKDSRIGANGAITCTLALLLKAVLITSILDHSIVASLGLLFVPIYSRSFMTWAMVGWPYAGGIQGMGSMYQTAGIRHGIAASLTAVIVTIGLWLAFGLHKYMNFIYMTVAIVIIIVVIALVGCLLSVYFSRKLGGLTGDTYGALNEILEIVLLLCIVMFLSVYSL